MPSKASRVLNSVLLASIAALLATGCEEYRHNTYSTPEPAQVSKPAAVVPTTAPSVAATPQDPSKPAEPATLRVDPAIPSYRAAQVVSGPLRSVGSDSMDRIMQLWEVEFKKTHPEIVVRHEGKGSGTALPALMKGLSDLGPMSRQITADESAAFTQRFNHAPTQLGVALDAIAVVVHPANPIAKNGLTFQQLDAIYSATRKRGGEQDITTWGQLGLTGPWANAPIVVCSRNKASGTYSFFREHVLKKGDFKPSNRELPGSKEVMDAVAADPNAIGFSSVGYVTPSVAGVPLSESAEQKAIAPTAEEVYANRYPLARYFYLTVNYDSSESLAPQTREFVRFALSAEGQTLVLKEGLFPLPAATTRAELAKVNLAQ